MKSLWSSAPFWKTLSGMKTRGRPDSEVVIGASLRKDLSTDLRIFSASEGVELGRELEEEGFKLAGAGLKAGLVTMGGF